MLLQPKPAGEDVDDEGDIDETLPGRDVCEIADPQLIRPMGLELAADPVEWAWRLRIGNSRAHDLATHYTAQPGFAQQALHRAAGHVGSLTPQLAPRPFDQWQKTDCPAIDGRMIDRQPRSANISSMLR